MHLSSMLITKLNADHIKIRKKDDFEIKIFKRVLIFENAVLNINYLLQAHKINLTRNFLIYINILHNFLIYFNLLSVHL